MINVLKQDFIEASGYFLVNYHYDLVYIQNFNKFKDIDEKSFSNSFYDFLYNYRVIRNIKKGKSDAVLKESVKWVEHEVKMLESIYRVDDFAGLLKKQKLTHGTALSLASKILFLSAPGKIFPYDSLAKKALGNKKYNSYDDFLSDVEVFKNKNINDIKGSLLQLKKFWKYTESNFNFKSYKKVLALSDFDIEDIRINRFTDLLLWVIGKNN